MTKLEQRVVDELFEIARLQPSYKKITPHIGAVQFTKEKDKFTVYLEEVLIDDKVYIKVGFVPGELYFIGEEEKKGGDVIGLINRDVTTDGSTVSMIVSLINKVFDKLEII